VLLFLGEVVELLRQLIMAGELAPVALHFKEGTGQIRVGFDRSAPGALLGILHALADLFAKLFERGLCSSQAGAQSVSQPPMPRDR